jgi:hypothetical protein
MHVSVAGLRFSGDSVEIRWNAIDGPELARTSGPDFSTEVTIPSAPTGLYAIMVISRSQGGDVAAAVATPFALSDAAAPGAAVANPTARSGASSGPSNVALALGGFAVLVVGGLLGMLLSGRRRRAQPQPR